MGGSRHASRHWHLSTLGLAAVSQSATRAGRKRESGGQCTLHACTRCAAPHIVAWQGRAPAQAHVPPSISPLAHGSLRVEERQIRCMSKRQRLCTMTQTYRAHSRTRFRLQPYISWFSTLCAVSHGRTRALSTPLYIDAGSTFEIRLRRGPTVKGVT